MTAETFDPTDQQTWDSTFDGGVEVGEMIADEFRQVLMRFLEQRVKPAAEWSGQPAGVLAAFAEMLHGVADAIEDNAGGRQ